MSAESHNRTAREDRLASVALLTAWIPFVVGGLLVIQTDTPPSNDPTLGMLSHALWAVAIVLLTLGVVSLVRWHPSLRQGIAGYLSVGVLGLGVLHGLQWVTWAYVDVRGAREGDHELVLDAIIVPFGAGHLLMYAILLGTGIGLFAWAAGRAHLMNRYVSILGVGLGTVTAGLAALSLVLAVGGGSEGHVIYNIAILLLPVAYLWVFLAGILHYRRG